MLAAILLAAAALQSAVDAERAFAAMAQTEGQWTAFRAYAAPEAVMFVPEAVNAREWLAGREDPPIPVMWWPGRAIVSCDGNMAVTTGPWVRAGGSLRGYFTTVWQRQADGSWKWLIDHGDVLKIPRAALDDVPVRNPVCGKPIPPTVWTNLAGRVRQKDFDHRLSDDRSLKWGWVVRPDGSRSISVGLWNGRGYDPVLVDEVAAAP